MWKYLILNTLWFAIIFLVHFYGSKKSQRFVLFLIFISAIFMMVRSNVDPVTWFYYFTFSLVIYWSAFQFKHWVFARSLFLDEELAMTSRQFEIARETLDKKEELTHRVDKKASEISHLFDKAKEMSQSLDSYETLVILTEELSKNFKFHSTKLFFFDEEKEAYTVPQESYELPYEIFDDHFDKTVFLKEKRTKGEVFPSDKKIIESVFRQQRNLRVELSTNLLCAAYPITLDKKLFGILFLMGLEAQDNFMLSILIESFITEMQRLKLYNQVQTLAITDGLTHVYVRRHLMERLEGEVDRCRRFGIKLTFLMIDVDYFKRFNDEYGHLVGDEVLKQVAETIKRNIREVDLVGRYGGEEFGVLLIETDDQGALLVAERIRRSIAEKLFKAYDENLSVTVSVGCCTFSKTANEPNIIVESADSALYQAKRQGRNRVCVFSNQS